ncbi:MAG: hypothetical protein DYG93_13360 [Leptolyngbya sp. PLA2]|nr:hypothetical protein [Leptolyngbya sp.]MCE7972635.1 hypothetical protein [Leptolyngbya sp. PL-A2]MCQ3941542.1 hypothetical protein [cyanobacterium CYA1]MCZ7634277.1 hypothetical protein [Phycisphaerales bacterium]MDL1905759.1 hypothetical protein [Synechococcales cyanobacterium CNB]GIK20529.1 MAG: hypothetical protein BroJett004_26930 [Planctomycetota bacterium]
MNAPTTLAISGEMIAVIAIVGTFVMIVVAVIASAISGVYKARERERTKREVAAYVAEGSMTPVEGERLIKADMPTWEKGES